MTAEKSTFQQDFGRNRRPVLRNWITKGPKCIESPRYQQAENTFSRNLTF